MRYNRILKRFFFAPYPSEQPTLDSLIGNSFRTLWVEMHAWLHAKIFPYDGLRLFDVISATVRLR
jgi:hypothetical protein